METVLVVEDSRAMQRTLQRLFEADGLAVRIASDGVAGLESFRKQTPSVVVLDLKLPRMPGKDDSTPEGWMARDGFHPGLLGYRQWGRQVAEAIG